MNTVHTLREYVDALRDAGILVESTVSDELAAREIHCLTYDTRALSEDALFICKGAHFKEEYLCDALSRGAIAYVAEKKHNVDAPCLLVNDIRYSLVVLGQLFYNHVTDKLTSVGITGTKGKSTTAYYVRYILNDWLRAQSMPECAILSSIDNYDGKNTEESHITTPEVLELYQHFENAYESGISHLVMEASSQALKYGRVRGITYDVAAFLNIGSDHISPIEHPDFEDYFNSKLKIFDSCRFGCVNTDAKYADRVIEYAKDRCNLIIIPVNFADRIEVYKGVVPVGFGTDAIGGVINIVTNKKRRRWFLDASYSYGSFNTHKSYVNFGQTFKNGFTYEINAFQNYSDNDYHVEAPVEDFETGRIDRDKKVRVKRFNDTYHNEAIIGKIGFVDKEWADRLLLGFTYSHMYKDIQTGVRQEIVYGQKHRKGHSLMPSLEYSKRDLLTKGLDVALTVNYNKNETTNVDTASYKYNWYGQKALMNSPGEQSYQYSRADNNNWNGTLTVNYRINRVQMLTFNHVLNAFHRSNTSLLAKEEQKEAIAKETRKNISGSFLPY